jgi:hypothetical protein
MSVDRRYVAGVPRKVPDGWFVAHNHVAFRGSIGLNGFRCWLQSGKPAPPLVECRCDFAAGRGYTHYRVEVRIKRPGRAP